MASAIVGVWLTLSSASGLAAGLQLKPGSFGYIALESVGIPFHLVTLLLVGLLLYLDFRRTSTTIDEINSTAERLKDTTGSETLQLLNTVKQSERGKLVFQAIQQHSTFFAVNPEDLEKADRAEVVFRQIEQKSQQFKAAERNKLLKFMACLSLVAVIGNPIGTVLVRAITPTERPVTIFLNKEDEVFRGELSIDIRYGTRQESVEVSDGKVVLSIPSYVNEISSIGTSDGRYRFEPLGPYDITASHPVEITVIDLESDPPSEPPSRFIIHNMPEASVVVGTKTNVAPSKAQLWYKNDSDKDFKLFLFECSTFYAGRQDYWYGFPLVRSREFQLWDRFPIHSKGWYAFIIRDVVSGVDTYLGCRQIFDKPVAHLTIKGSSGEYRAEFE